MTENVIQWPLDIAHSLFSWWVTLNIMVCDFWNQFLTQFSICQSIKLLKRGKSKRYWNTYSIEEFHWRNVLIYNVFQSHFRPEERSLKIARNESSKILRTTQETCLRCKLVFKMPKLALYLQGLGWITPPTIAFMHSVSYLPWLAFKVGERVICPSVQAIDNFYNEMHSNWRLGGV